MHESIEQIHAAGDILRSEHEASDAAGRLTDVAAQVLRDSGGIRLLQSKQHGGFQEHPTVFFEWVRAVARYNPSAGWVAGVVGVHPWEFALADPRLGEEIYGDSADTWTASPYMPAGRAIRVDGGFQLTGEWSYSTGTDHCDWVILGGLVCDEQGEPLPELDYRHFVLPRGGYEIVDGSWNVMGLGGTGSKNVRVEGSLVPEYRTMDHIRLSDCGYADRMPDSPLYGLAFACIFSSAIASATLGIAQGAIAEYRRYLETRISATFVVGKEDPFQQQALAEAEADVESAIVNIDSLMTAMYDQVAAGNPVTQSDRLLYRRNQVRSVQHVLGSIDTLFSRAGSSAISKAWAIERYWRDLRTGGTHIGVAADTIYTSWANDEFNTGGAINTFH